MILVEFFVKLKYYYNWIKSGVRQWFQGDGF